MLSIYLVAGITLPSLLILPGCSNAHFGSTVQRSECRREDAVVHDVGKLS